MKFILRDMQELDLSKIVKLEKQNHPNFWSYGVLSAQFKSLPADFIINYFWVIEELETNDIAGYCFIKQIDYFAEIYNLAINTKYRNLGLAKAIISNLYKKLIDNQAQRVELEVRAENIEAQKLYKSCKMRQVGVKYSYYNYTIDKNFITEDAFLFLIEMDKFENAITEINRSLNKTNLNLDIQI